MESWFIGWVVFLVSVVMIPLRIVNWHLVPKHTIILVASAICVVSLGLHGQVKLGLVQQLAVGWAVWCLSSIMWSQNPSFSIRTTLTQVAGVVIFLFMTTFDVEVFPIALMGALGLAINSIFSLWQHFHGDPWIPEKTSRCGFATFGNRCWYASYCAGAIAFPLWLTFSHHWTWGYLVALTLTTLILARSKSSLLSLSMGLGLLLALPFIRKILVKYQSIRFRLYYWRAGWELLKERPLIGHGFRQYRSELYRIHTILNERTNGKFLEKKRYHQPKPREPHNDFIGLAVDCGLIGLVLLLGTITICLIAQPVSWLHYGLIALLLNALVFYPFKTPAGLLIFWVLMGLVAPTMGSYYTIPQISILLSLPILIVAYRYFISNYTANEGYRKGDPNYFNKALDIDKNNSTLLMTQLTILRAQDPVAAEFCANQILATFDGDTVPWAVWIMLGELKLGSGQILHAKVCFERALKTLPYSKKAKDGIKTCNEVLEGGQIVINFQKEKPNGLPNNGLEHSKVRA